ncbi:hypothetical protein ABW21_db0203842 [Orbilia brochopaga]|nr:hypothetical protein ABW21_db0203842 [Drechslerella brochopaga]
MQNQTWAQHLSRVAERAEQSPSSSHPIPVPRRDPSAHPASVPRPRTPTTAEILARQLAEERRAFIREQRDQQRDYQQRDQQQRTYQQELQRELFNQYQDNVAIAQEQYVRQLQVAQIQYGAPGGRLPSSIPDLYGMSTSSESLYPTAHPAMNHGMHQAMDPAMDPAMMETQAGPPVPPSPTIPTEEAPPRSPERVWPSQTLTNTADRRRQQLNALDQINQRIDRELDVTPAVEIPPMEPQIPWEQMEHHMRAAYIQKLDKGVMDCLIRQKPDMFIFFDIKYTHVGDYLELGFPRMPAQICLMNIEGEIIYQANIAMFDPRTGEELLCMIDWLKLVNAYLISGAMSRRWYDLDRMNAAIEVMRGYFCAHDIRRLSIQRVRQDLDRLDYRNRILFTHDPSLRTYDLFRKLLLTNSLPPRLLTLSSHKMIKMLLPELPTNIYEFYMQLVDHESFGTGGKVILKNISVADAGYIRQIFRFFTGCWDTFQKSKVGRPAEEAAERLVDIWDSIPPDVQVFDPASDSENDDDEGLTQEQVDAHGRGGMAALMQVRNAQRRGRRYPPLNMVDQGTQTATEPTPATVPRQQVDRPFLTVNPAAGPQEYRGARVENRRPVTPPNVRIQKGDFTLRT